jgi:Short C-terminal domain
MPFGRRQRVRRRRVAAAGAGAGAYAVHKHREHKEQDAADQAEPEQASPQQDGSTDQDAGSSTDSVDQLTQLASLRDSGALTQAEFEAEKQKIIDA